MRGRGYLGIGGGVPVEVDIPVHIFRSVFFIPLLIGLIEFYIYSESKEEQGILVLFLATGVSSRRRRNVRGRVCFIR